MPDPDMRDAAAIIEVATEATTPFAVASNVDYYLVRDTTGGVSVIDMVTEREQHAETPRRIKGHPQVTTPEAFKTYVRRHQTEELEIWADEAHCSVTAVFDSHYETAGWGEHRCTLTLQQTVDWQTWAGTSGKMLRQTEFAEFIEDNIANIVAPPAADMLELAQSFQAASGVSFESSKFLDSGHRQLVYKETVEATAGRKGQIAIPNHFELALQPFVGLDIYKVRARFRYRINDGNLLLGYKLDRPDDVLRTAFEDTATKISDDLKLPVLDGRSW